jgi:hypothetical protein
MDINAMICLTKGDFTGVDSYFPSELGVLEKL